MPVAHVEVFPYYTRTQQPLQLAAARDGRYQVQIDERGLVRLRFHGPLHETHGVVVLIEDETPIELDVQLQRGWLDTDQSFTRVVTSYTDFSYEEGQPFDVQPDGAFTAVIDAPGDSLVFSLPGARTRQYKGWVYGDVTADAFRYIGQGEYRMLVASPEEQVRLTVRPRKPGTREAPQPVVAFGAGNAHAAALWALYERMQDAQAYRFNGLVRAGAQLLLSTADKDLDNMLRQEIMTLEIEIERETDPFQRHLLLVFYLHRASHFPAVGWSGMYRSVSPYRLAKGGSLNRAYLQRTLKEVPPASMVWAIQPALLQVMVEERDMSDEALAYVEQVIEAHPDRGVRYFALYNMLDGLYAHQGFSQAVAAYVERYAQAAGIEDFMRQLPAGQALNVTAGRPAPPFIRMPWEPEQGLSPDSLKGKVLLLDFWTSTCEACAQDEGVLRQAHEAYGPAGLQIVRISLDVDHLHSYEDQGMPWVVYQGEDGFKSRIAISYEVMSLPHRVLIDREGLVEAAGGDLFGDNLLASLRSVFE